VLLRGGRREADEVDVAGVVEFAIDAAGEGVDVSDSASISSSACIFAEGLGELSSREFYAGRGPNSNAEGSRCEEQSDCLEADVDAKRSSRRSMSRVSLGFLFL
jgi:hypothetical protein